MKVLILLMPLLPFLANAQEEASLMQGLLARQKQLTSDTGDYYVNHSNDGNNQLLDTATQMLKSGATYEFLQFAEAVRESINDMLKQINEQHDADQNNLNEFDAKFKQAQSEMEECFQELNEDIKSLTQRSITHKECRREESVLCADTRRCEAELETLALKVQEETDKVNNEWYALAKHRCPDYLEDDLSLSCPWDFTDATNKEGPETGQTQPGDQFPSLGIFESEFRKNTRQMLNAIDTSARDAAIFKYEAKLKECQALDSLEDKTALCDAEQDTLRKLGCGLHHSECKLTFFDLYRQTKDNYEEVKDLHKQREQDRMNQTTTLMVAECLVNETYNHVQEAIVTGGECISEVSDPEEIEEDIQSCHRMNGTNETLHLVLVFPDVPDELPLPNVTLPCSDEWNTEHVGLFHDFDAWKANLQDLQLESSLVIPSGETEGWGGCAAPKVCLGCTDAESDSNSSPSGLPQATYSDIPATPPQCSVYSYDGRQVSIERESDDWESGPVYHDRQYTFKDFNRRLLDSGRYHFIKTTNGNAVHEGKYSKMNHVALNITCDAQFSVYVQFVGFEHHDDLRECTREFDSRHQYRCTGSSDAFLVETKGKHWTPDKTWLKNMDDKYKLAHRMGRHDSQWPNYMPNLTSFGASDGQSAWNPEFENTHNEFHKDGHCTSFERVFQRTALIPGNGCHDGSYLVFITGVGS